MALFVVACGILLMLGGAFSLLLGFDIVMTERGAAMTIGGVVALSGGVIAVGIGLALVRLNQLLRMLEARAAKPARAGVPDRPVVPITAEDLRPPAAPSEPAAPPPLTHPQPAVSDPRVPAAAAAGIAAIGAASVLGRPSSGEAAPAARETLLADAFPPASPVVERPTASAAPSPSMGDPDPFPAGGTSEEVARDDLHADHLRLDALQPEDSSREDFIRDSVETPGPSPSTIALPLDLEEELSRALAETSLPPDPPAPPAASAPPADEASSASADDRSFEDGLSKLLGRPVRPPTAAIEPPARQQDLADMLNPTTPTVIMAETEEQTSAFEPVMDEQPSGHQVKDWPSSPAQPADPHPTPEEFAEREEVNGAETLSSNESEGAETYPPIDENRDDDLFDDPAPVHAEERPDMDEQPSISPEEPAPAPESPQVPVLGTYTIGGRTYRMFGDGSVEAVSEGGDIERFASMDELRKHLARA